jgi:hypothetical protein
MSLSADLDGRVSTTLSGPTGLTSRFLRPQPTPMSMLLLGRPASTPEIRGFMLMEFRPLWPLVSG